MNVVTGSLTLVVALLFTAAGVGGIVHLFWRANGWPQTQGRVVASHRRLEHWMGLAFIVGLLVYVRFTILVARRQTKPS